MKNFVTVAAALVLLAAVKGDEDDAIRRILSRNGRSDHGFPYNNRGTPGGWESRNGVESYGWDSRRPLNSPPGPGPSAQPPIGPGTAPGPAPTLGASPCSRCAGVAPNDGYRGNGYDNLSPEWQEKQKQKEWGNKGGTWAGSVRPIPGSWDSKYEAPSGPPRGPGGYPGIGAEPGSYPGGGPSSYPGAGPSSYPGAGGGPSGYPGGGPTSYPGAGAGGWDERRPGASPGWTAPSRWDTYERREDPHHYHGAGGGGYQGGSGGYGGGPGYGSASPGGGPSYGSVSPGGGSGYGPVSPGGGPGYGSVSPGSGSGGYDQAPYYGYQGSSGPTEPSRWDNRYPMSGWDPYWYYYGPSYGSYGGGSTGSYGGSPGSYGGSTGSYGSYGGGSYGRGPYGGSGYSGSHGNGGYGGSYPSYGSGGHGTYGPYNMYGSGSYGSGGYTGSYGPGGSYSGSHSSSGSYGGPYGSYSGPYYGGTYGSGPNGGSYGGSSPWSYATDYGYGQSSYYGSGAPPSKVPPGGGRVEDWQNEDRYRPGPGSWTRPAADGYRPGNGGTGTWSAGAPPYRPSTEGSGYRPEESWGRPGGAPAAGGWDRPSDGYRPNDIYRPGGDTYGRPGNFRPGDERWDQGPPGGAGYRPGGGWQDKPEYVPPCNSCSGYRPGGSVGVYQPSRAEYDRPGSSGGYDRPAGGYAPAGPGHERPVGGYDRPGGNQYDRPGGRPVGGYDANSHGSHGSHGSGHDSHDSKGPGGLDRYPGHTGVGATYDFGTTGDTSRRGEGGIYYYDRPSSSTPLEPTAQSTTARPSMSSTGEPTTT